MNVLQSLNERLLKEQEEKSHREKSGLWKPSLFGRCFRKQYWERKDFPQSDPPDVRALRIFKCGHLFEDFVRSQLPPHETQVEVKTTDLLGYADVVTETEVIEIKSTHSGAFHYMRKDNYDVNKEKRYNILQCATYAWLLDRPVMKLIYVSKDDLCMEEYAFYTDKWKDDVEKELKELRDIWDKDLLPPAIPRAFKTECKYCSHRTICKETENENT